MTLTYHAQVERADRLQALEEVLGFTKTVLEVSVPENYTRYCLTSSGIIIVKNLFHDAVITAYMANIDQCTWLYKLAGKAQVAPKVYKRVIKNAERHAHLFYIQGLTNSAPYDIIQSSKRKELITMKGTGIVRRIDDLGRVVIPKEIRKKSGIVSGDPLELYLGEDGTIVFKKYIPEQLSAGLEDLFKRYEGSELMAPGAVHQKIVEQFQQLIKSVEEIERQN